MMGLPIHIDEIDDRSDEDAIDEVAGGAPMMSASPTRAMISCRARLAAVHSHADERRDRDHPNQHGLERKVRRVQKGRTRRPCSAHGEIHEAGMTVTLACSGTVDRTTAFVS